MNCSPVFSSTYNPIPFGDSLRPYHETHPLVLVHVPPRGPAAKCCKCTNSLYSLLSCHSCRSLRLCHDTPPSLLGSSFLPILSLLAAPPQNPLLPSVVTDPMSAILGFLRLCLSLCSLVVADPFHVSNAELPWKRFTDG
jgi:hypothetical protein